MNEHSTPRRRAPGFSLIELLVSMAIGLVLTIAITSVMIRSEGSKRSTSSVNEINQTGAFAAYTLDRAIRSAGSGFSQRWSETYGCLLDVKKDSNPVLPLPAIASTSAFAKLTFPIRLAPVIIAKGYADTTGSGAETRGDLLLVMGGTGGVSESPQPVNAGGVSSSQLLLQNTLGFVTDDLILLSDPGVAGGCMVQQVGTHVASDYGQVLPLSGAYFATRGTRVDLASFGASTSVMQIGRAGVNPPQFQAYGVGANRTLMAFDLLTPMPGSGVPDFALADGVVEMRALYGIDNSTPPIGRVDAWIDPKPGSGWAATDLTDGSANARTKLRQISAVKVGLILRTSLQERSPTGAASGALAPETYANAAGTNLTLFGDLGSPLQQTRPVTGTDLNFRFRTVEVTVPIRNVLMAP